ncbi:hypothetical protein BGW36DRAFT_430398 [Talaromyces proteolyticus]|uniref:DUF6594 domain-containing protein n=1 Tax=Talaromyces proteolyticus TaxID=1131652 RepID=A0AAD4PXE9_9EURO|nr:uncharacterized protein BGW36DRAFT_430398 [Talaromyces proteolyticus]KAH8692643.1 hypothetical protein BGW36DRAFT_430398 [Talaromyces proteolyticus]
MSSSVAGRRKGSKGSKVARPKSDSIPSKSTSLTISGPTKAMQSSARTSAKNGNGNLPTKSQSRMTQGQNAADPKPNVFEFLQEGESSSSPASESDSGEEEEEEQENRGTVEAHTPVNSRLARDVGLPSPESSFRASSPEQTFSVASRDSISTDIEPTTPPDGSPAAAYLRLAHKHITQSRGRRSDVHYQGRSMSRDHQSDYSAPEDYYISTRSRPPQRRKHSSSPVQNGTAGPLVPADKKREMTKNDGPSSEAGCVSGYASLASKLDSSGKDTQKLTPLYRRFENVNHRILLYLQDEISQMEEELQLMDKYDANHRAAVAEEEGVLPEPASRRMDVEACHFSGFHARRTELMERLSYKINQYNDALYNYNRMRQSLSPASSRDVHTYRAWIHENAPIAKNETKFLDHELDLISMNAVANAKGDNSILYFIIGVMSAALLLPLLAY